MQEVLPKHLVFQIRNGEGISVEFKKAHDALPDNLFETVCSMLNRNGGHIFLGVKNDGTVQGINPLTIAAMKKDFANLCNNPQKIFPTIHIELQEYQYEGKTILYAYIYESSEVHRTANRIFDRNEDGDFDITDNTSLVSQMYIRKNSTYFENKIYSHATIDDLREDLIARARQLAVNRLPNHPWSKMTNTELLRSAGLYDRNLQTGEEGINLAGILLLGKDETINSALSYYRTDAILRVENLDRYDDRDDIRTNLLDSYDRLVSFVRKHTNEKFHLEQGQRIDIRNVIARELCSNMLIHREYSNPLPAQLIITKDSITTENANKPRFVGYIDIDSFSPYPKNPKIANFFKEIGYADELGSGIKKIAKYAKIYGGVSPSFREDEPFRAVVYTHKNARKDGKSTKGALVEYIMEHDGVTRKEINMAIYPKISGTPAQKSAKLHSAITTLSNNGIIKNIGSNRSPRWVYCADKEQLQ